MRWGKREIIYLSQHCHHQNDSCIKMGSDESRFNVAVGSDGQSHKTVSTIHSLFHRIHSEQWNIYIYIALRNRCLGRVTRTMSVALLLRNNRKRKKSNFRSPAPPPYS